MNRPEWASIHIFHYANQDELLVHGIRPLMVSAPPETRFFFLRYWRGGPHVRLRIVAPPHLLQEEAKKVWDGLECFLRVRPSMVKFGPADVDAVQRQLAILEGIPPEEVVGDNTLRMASYVPELTKYGGPEGIHVAETLFIESSGLVLDVLPGILSNPARREWMALEMLVAAVNAVMPTPFAMTQFLSFYEEVWSKYVALDEGRRWDEVEAKHQRAIDSVVTRAYRDGGAGSAEVSRQWAASVVRANAALSPQALSRVALGERPGLIADQRSAVLAQYLHTHHNRLGLHPRQEAFLAHVAHRAMARAEEMRFEPAAQ